MSAFFNTLSVLLVVIICAFISVGYKVREDKTKCPKVKALRNFDLNQMLGFWYVVQYYATSEEELIYKCMRAVFSMPTEGMEVEMNVTYSFIDDPDNDLLCGNITWRIPDPSQPAHWQHEEDTYEGIYNTFILDSDNKDWSLLLHCAEKPKSPRYLTSLIMSRNTTLPAGVISYLRDKLPRNQWVVIKGFYRTGSHWFTMQGKSDLSRYDITLEYMFPMQQSECGDASRTLHYAVPLAKHSKHSSRKHPFRHRGRRSKANKRKET